jgi:Trpc4-associated protein
MFQVGTVTKTEIQRLGNAWHLRKSNLSKPVEIDSDIETELSGKPKEKPPEEGEKWILAKVDVPGLERLYSFLADNLVSLMRDLLAVVDTSNINHENICCLNTAVALLVLARRQDGGDECVACMLRCIRNGVTTAVKSTPRKLGGCEGSDIAQEGGQEEEPKTGPPRSGSEILANFRQLLWFWQEYYMHRGRDRLGVEFNSHINFHEWKSLVELLCADDGSPTSLVASSPSFPLSPYSRPPRPDRLSPYLHNV